MFKKLIIAAFLSILLFAGCAHQPISGEPAPPVDSPSSTGTPGTGGGTVIKTY